MLSHVSALSSSAQQNSVAIDVRGIVDPEHEIGVPGGQALVSLGRAAASIEPDPAATVRLVDALGPDAALTAVEVAAAFQLINRVMEATGQPSLVRQREIWSPELEALGASTFHGSGLTIDMDAIEAERSLVWRMKRKLRAIGSG